MTINRRELANAIRFLSLDAVEKAKSGHPGMPLGMADIAEVLWNDYLKHNPKNPEWFNRDRFIISNGHGSMLLYSLLHLTGYDLTIEDLKQFRQIHSRTPGHPELGVTPGVEVTTGPLGQGFACAVGIALAEKLLASEFNKHDNQIIDHYTYCFVGDGCLMEGLSHEVGSLAGTLNLTKLILFWDDNGISIDGNVKNWFLDNTAQRFNSYNWYVINNVDGHSPNAVNQAIKQAQKQSKPTLICCKTKIGFGSPNLEGTEKTHGSPLGTDEVEATRKNLKWKHSAFNIPKDLYIAWDATEKGEIVEKKWQKQWQQYKIQYPDAAIELQRRIDKKLPTDWKNIIQQLLVSTQKNLSIGIATRTASQKILDSIGGKLPELIGGSADLSHSNLTMHKFSKPVTPNNISGNYIYYGVREFGMASIMNGLHLHGASIPYGGTFLTFADYARNAIRMSALMQQQIVYVFTHDSIGLGEDGPTHQPIEHLAMLRMTSNVSLWRPCDATETVISWQAAIERKKGPTCLILSRQKLPIYKRSDVMLHNISRGGYILKDCDNNDLQVIIIATGSEVKIALAAANHLAKEGIQLRVVFMPSVDVFLQQDIKYRTRVLPNHVKVKVAVEAGVTEYWRSFVGDFGKIVGINVYGKSASCQDIYDALGLNKEAVIDAVRQSILLNDGE